MDVLALPLPQAEPSGAEAAQPAEAVALRRVGPKRSEPLVRMTHCACVCSTTTAAADKQQQNKKPATQTQPPRVRARWGGRLAPCSRDERLRSSCPSYACPPPRSLRSTCMSARGTSATPSRRRSWCASQCAKAIRQYHFLSACGQRCHVMEKTRFGKPCSTQTSNKQLISPHMLP